MKVTIGNKDYQVIEKPRKHVLIPTKKELHGWWPGKRECTAERMLINPYNGCDIGCFFCYSLALPGNFQTFREKNIIIVAKDFDKNIAKQLDSVKVASCGYLSPVTDPFQPINKTYRLSEKIIKAFIDRNIPVEFVTKAKIPQEAISLIKSQRHSFGQVSILTSKEEIRKALVPGSASTKTLFENLERLSKEGIHTVARIDPIFPYITDEKTHLEELVKMAIDFGANHIVASILDIPFRIQPNFLNNLKNRFSPGLAWDYGRLYTEDINGYLNANINYRKRVFDRLRNICERQKVSFALCMEYELSESQPVGLNREFASSINCEGIDIPIYKKDDGEFSPITDCRGNCLNCTEARCGIEDLAMGKPGSKKDWKLKDYRRWSVSTNMKLPL